MPKIKIQDTEFDCDVAVFDKDGTLIDFHRFWGARARKAINNLLVHVSNANGIGPAIYQTIGYDPENGVTAGTGPLATAPLSKFYVIVSTVLYQHGIDWEMAEALVAKQVIPIMGALPENETIHTLGNINEQFTLLKDAGIHVAIATSDNRDITEAMMHSLNITEQIELMLCGDDQHIAPKPSADVLDYVARHFSTTNEKIMMVGDTIGDMLTGVNGKAGLKVGVRGGAARGEELAEYADLLVESLDEIDLA